MSEEPNAPTSPSEENIGEKLDGIRDQIKVGIEALTEAMTLNTATVTEILQQNQRILASQETRLQRVERKVFPAPIKQRLPSRHQKTRAVRRRPPS